MRTFDCFRDNYVATFDGWNNDKVQELIEFACHRAEIPVPDVARHVFLRASLDKELKLYFKGETEKSDFYSICIWHTKNNDEGFRVIVDYLAEKSSKLCEYIAGRRGLEVIV